MSSLVSQTPFVICPDDDLLQKRPELRRYSHELARAYANNRFATEESLQAIGQALWQSVVDEATFSRARQQAGNQILPIVVESGIPVIQQLPWETVYQADHGFLARANGFTLSRRLPQALAELPAPQYGPLRVLLFTTLPDDLDAEHARLDVEEEQAQIQEALTPAIMAGLVQLEMPDDGRFQTLRNILQRSQPHLVFLSGHGKFFDAREQAEPPFAVFQFEDDNGHTNLVRDFEIAEAFAGTQVRCVVLSACESGMGASDALTSGLAWALSARGLPHVVGMRESVLDRAGTLFSRAFADAVVRQEPIDVALQLGRQAIQAPLANSPLANLDAEFAQQSLAQWCLPMLLSQDARQPLLDWDFEPRPPAQRLVSETLNTVVLPPRFIGRRTELRQIKSRLNQGCLPQLLVTGPGGQGKTALAGKLAQDLARRGYAVLAYSARPENEWADFQLELELLLDGGNTQKYTHFVARYEAEVDKAKLLLRLLLAQFGGRVMLFLDNLESVQDGATQALTDKRLAAWIAAAQSLAGQGLILLLTSRWRLPEWPEADYWPLTHANYGDFLQMARQELPLRFLQNRDRLRRVYRVLHGNGRGLTFFAAAVQNFSGEAEEEAFLVRLAEAERKTQMDMALDLIVASLPAAAKKLLHRLPAYQVPVPVEGVVKLGLDLPQPVEPLLQRLLAVSLVEPQANVHWQVVEYQLPPLVTEWLHQKGVPSPAQSLWQTAARYLAYLYRQERRTLPQAVAVYQAWQAAAEPDIANRFALDWIIGPLNRAGLYQTLLDEWLPAACETDDPKIKAEALGQTGKQHIHLGNYGMALTYLEQSLKIRREIGDKSGEGTTLNNISQIYDARGDYETALTYLEQSLKISREIGDKSGEGTTLNNISQIYDARGDYETALTYLEQSLKIRREIGDKSGEGTTLNNISQIFKARGDYETALTYLEQSLKIRREIGDKSGEGTTLNNMATTAHARGDYETALTYLEQSLKIRREIGDKSGEGTTLNNISQIFKARGDYETALTYLEQSLKIRREIGDKSGEGTTLNNISQIYDARGDYETALTYLEQSLKIRREIGDKSGEGTTLNNISQIFKARGDYETALTYLEQSLKISREIGDKSGEGTTLNNISQIFKARGDYETALTYLEQSLKISREIGDKSGEGTTLNNMATTAHARGDYETALTYLEQSLKISREIGDAAGLCATLFNMGHIHLQNGEQNEALSAWVTVYQLAKRINLAQALEALSNLSEQLGAGKGLAIWERLSQQTSGE